MHISKMPDDDATIAERILAAVSDMKRNGSFTNGTALCWSPAELELLAMYAIDAKNKLSRQPERLNR